MNMKEHILAALQEQFEHWEELLARLDESQITAPRFDLDWSIKDVMAHLWGWQQISLARVQAAAQNHTPQFPQWVMEAHHWEEDANLTNNKIYETYHEKNWDDIHQNWRGNFLALLESAKQIEERYILDGDKYPWLKGYSLAAILIATYDHHQEHLEKILADA